MKIRVMFRVIACALLLALLIPAAKVEAAKLSKQRVKIGVLATLTGSGFSLGRNTVAALQIAAADIQNIHPQYNPVRYRFLIRDTQHDPSLALNAIQDLHARGVKIIIGPQTSSEVAMIKPFADAHDMLVISQVAQHPRSPSRATISFGFALTTGARLKRLWRCYSTMAFVPLFRFGGTMLATTVCTTP